MIEATPELYQPVKAKDGEPVCGRIFRDVIEHHWLCTRRAHPNGSHAAFLEDGTLACLEGQRPFWQLTGNQAAARSAPTGQTVQLDGEAMLLVSAAMARARAAEDGLGHALTKLNMQAEHIAELERQLYGPSEHMAELERQLNKATSHRVGVRANIRDALIDLQNMRPVVEAQLHAEQLQALDTILGKLTAAARR